ncbi:MAG: ATP-binding protein [Candidatus Adiutrix sp.]|jgi:predicted ATP-dependent endonuclease of OLD family|nr:ATP-binding protein [Candidatus Adiutrix sp.]
MRAKKHYKSGSAPIRIRSLIINGYKGIENLKLDFPRPRMADDPDIFALGSQNGVGKTSVLECCSLLMLAFILESGKSKFSYDKASILKQSNLLDIVINSRSKQTSIKGVIDIGNEHIDASITIERTGAIRAETSLTDKMCRDNGLDSSMIDLNFFIESICGLTSNPVVIKPFLLFHSYRKIQEGNLEIGSLLKSERHNGVGSYISRKDAPISVFKNQILLSLMANANLFEAFQAYPDKSDDINKLNELMSDYANGGTINKLQPLGDNTLDIRVRPKDGGESFSFDGLSSGQKEIISTMFMVWHYTKSQPAVVMIDEPELHLNAQWHKGVIRNLVKYMPKNQYIIATHSEDVMAAVNKDRRLILAFEDQDGEY